MRLNIMMSLDNEASQPRPKEEVEQLLAALAKQIGEQGFSPETSIVMRDMNGNRVGVADVFK